MRIHDVLGDEAAPIKILYINPNSSLHFTKETVDYLQEQTPQEVRIDFYTAPDPAPASIDGLHDGILSTAVVLKDLGLVARDEAQRDATISQTYSAVIVACFSAHPLVPALMESLPDKPTQPPVIGIFEAGVYAALQLSRTFGIATTGMRECSSGPIIVPRHVDNIFPQNGSRCSSSTCVRWALRIVVSRASEEQASMH